MQFAFHPNIQLLKLGGRIRGKIVGSNQMRLSSLKYQFCASFDPVIYNIFNIRSARGMEAMVHRHIVSGSPILKLYTEFANTDESTQSSIYVPVQEVETKEQVESPTTQLCNGFTTLLESSHYDILESSMGRHLLISALDFNRDR